MRRHNSLEMQQAVAAHEALKKAWKAQDLAQVAALLDAIKVRRLPPSPAVWRGQHQRYFSRCLRAASLRIAEIKLMYCQVHLLELSFLADDASGAKQVELLLARLSRCPGAAFQLTDMRWQGMCWRRACSTV